VTVAATAHCVKLIISVPLETESHHFTLYKITTLPERITSGKFVRFSVECSYLVIQTSQRDYILFSETDFSKCSKGDIVICPADTTVYSAQRLSCVFRLYFQTVSHYHLCKRELLLHYQTPTLQHHSLRIYHFPTPQLVTLRCPRSADPSSHSELLSGAGLIYNASTCHISTSDMQTLPELSVTTQTELHTPRNSLPTKIPIVTDCEIKQLHDITPTELQQLDDVKSRVTTTRQTMDTDTLLHIYYASQIQDHKQPWKSIVAFYMSIIAILGVPYVHLYPHVRNIRCNTSQENNPPHVPSSTTPDLQPQTSEPKSEEPKATVLFTSYPMQQTS